MAVDPQMTKLASLLKSHDAALCKRTTRRLLMKQVRLCVSEHEEQVRRRSAAVFSPMTWTPVTYDGVTYVTAMTAFQAQKAPQEYRRRDRSLGSRGDSAAASLPKSCLAAPPTCSCGHVCHCALWASCASSRHRLSRVHLYEHAPCRRLRDRRRPPCSKHCCGTPKRA